jgi:5-methylcytosine-specific restriction endonuclease McrA
MKWNYICPQCNKWVWIEWADRSNRFKCEENGKIYDAPSPSEQHSAYVDTHEWPEEIEAEVVLIKGTKCTVPGCEKKYETLDHRVAYSKGGRTSVENLFPMCNEHNQSKGDLNYNAWLLARQMLDKS